MRKIIFLILALVICFSACATKDKASETAESTDNAVLTLIEPRRTEIFLEIFDKKC